jgi:hypothetical protein
MLFVLRDEPVASRCSILRANLYIDQRTGSSGNRQDAVLCIPARAKKVSHLSISVAARECGSNFVQGLIECALSRAGQNKFSNCVFARFWLARVKLLQNLFQVNLALDTMHLRAYTIW